MRLLDQGLEPVVAPLIRIRPLRPTSPNLSEFDGLIFTSRNGVAAWIDLALPDPGLGRPVFTVGTATAEAARQAGFSRVETADGDLGALAGLVQARAAGGRLLHPGALRPAGDLAAALARTSEIVALPVYEAISTDLAPPEDFDAVLIHSPRAARELAQRLPPTAARGRLAVAISAAAADPLARLDFAAIRVAARPDETALFDTLQATLGKPPPAV